MISVLIVADEAYGKKLADQLTTQQELPISCQLATGSTAALEINALVDSPFDAFIVTEKLTDGETGSELLRKLIAGRPASQAILITEPTTHDSAPGVEKTDYYQRLEDKAFDLADLLEILDQAGKHPATEGQVERWLAAMTEVVEQTQSILNVNEIAHVIVEGGLKLGFERARLWLLETDQYTLIGEAQAGHWRADYFQGVKMKIANSVYDRDITKRREPAFFYGFERGPSYLFQAYGKAGFDKPTGRWAHIPLWSGDKCFGLLVLDNVSYRLSMKRRETEVLSLFGHQAAAALKAALEYAATNTLLSVLHRTSEEMMRLAGQDENKMWWLVLTAATAGYGLGFNRAALFRLDANGKVLRGHAGVGQMDGHSANVSWLRDMENNTNFDGFLAKLQQNDLEDTQVYNTIKNMSFDMTQDQGVFSEVLNTGRRKTVSTGQAAELLPPAFINNYKITDYEVLPLHAGEKVLGLVVVDNLHNRKPLRELYVSRLEIMLNQAALTLENLRTQKSQSTLITITHEVLREATTKPLKATLTRICAAARQLSGADFVCIYPLKENTSTVQYDLDQFASTNLGVDPRPENGPRTNGLTEKVMSLNEPLLIGNIRQEKELFAGELLADHPFLKAHGFQAVIGVVLRDAITETISGVMYLNYRQPKSFERSDREQVVALAGLAATAIRDRRQATTSWDVFKELLSAALHYEGETEQAARKRVIGVILQQVQQVLKMEEISVRLIIRQWEPGETVEEPPRLVMLQYYRTPDNLVESRRQTNIDLGIVGRTFKRAEAQLIPDVEKEEDYYNFDEQFKTRSELDVPIISQNKVIGIINVESRELDFFTVENRDTLLRLCDAAALALENLQRREQLARVLKVAENVTAMVELDETLKTIVNSIRVATPDLHALTLWYRQSDSKPITLGTSFGVKHLDRINTGEPTPTSTVTKVMAAKKTLFIDARSDHELLSSRFARDEGIKSVAAFPLVAKDVVIGVMFLSYRESHEFTEEERHLLQFLADITASNINDALNLNRSQLNQRLLQMLIKTVGATTAENEVFDLTLASLKEIFPDSTPHLLQWDPRTDILKLYSIDKLGIAQYEYPMRPQTTFASTIAQASLDNKEVHTGVADPDHPNYFIIDPNTKAEFCTSLMKSHELLGLLVLESRDPNAYKGNDVKEVVEILRSQLTLTMDRVRQTRNLRNQRMIIELTSWATQIAHMMNRELAQIKNRTYRLKQNQPYESVVEIAHEIENYVDSLGGTVESTDQGANTAPTDLYLDHYIREVVDDLTRNKRAIKVRFELECGDRRILINKETLRQIIQYIMQNALSEKVAAKEIIIYTKVLENNNIQIEIENTGSPLPEKIRAKIFDSPIVSDVPNDGGGLGLLMAASLVDSIKGTIRLLPPDTKRGTVFAITVPDSPEAAN